MRFSRFSRLGAAPCLGLALASSAACSGSTPVVNVDDAGPGDSGSDASACPGGACAQSKIQHVVVLVMENKTFDVELGRYCTAPTGSSPTCTTGPSCCEAGPATDPSGASPITLDDTVNGGRDPNHNRTCETDEIHGGAMDNFVAGALCGNPGNFAYLDPTLAQPLWDLAAGGAIADRYFQSVVGASSGNDQFFARAVWRFDDNVMPSSAISHTCDASGSDSVAYTETNIADLLAAKGFGVRWYMDGYARGLAAGTETCPPAPADCGLHLPLYPCDFSPADDPLEYYDSTRDKPANIADLAQLTTDLAASTLPAVTFVKPIGYKSDHPANHDKTSDAIAFITSTTSQVLASPVGPSTLVLVTWDEGGGFFDHVTPPPAAAADGQPYGTRVPLFALGPFAKKNGVAHTTLEHSSVVKFIEWNWLGATGQLGTRDKEVHNLGGLLDSSATGVAVPED